MNKQAALVGSDFNKPSQFVVSYNMLTMLGDQGIDMLHSMEQSHFTFKTHLDIKGIIKSFGCFSLVLHIRELVT
jgi:hypothetical protein